MTSTFRRFGVALLLAASFVAPAAAADEAVQTAATGLVPFASEEGLARLARASAKVDFPTLANQFEPQSNAAFCGPTHRRHRAEHCARQQQGSAA